MNFIEYESVCVSSDSDSDSECININSSLIDDGDTSEKSWISIKSSKNDQRSSDSENSYQFSLSSIVSNDSYESSFIDDNSDFSNESSSINDNCDVLIANLEKKKVCRYYNKFLSDDDDEAMEIKRHAREPYKMPKNIIKRMLESDTVRYNAFKQNY